MSNSENIIIRNVKAVCGFIPDSVFKPESVSQNRLLKNGVGCLSVKINRVYTITGFVVNSEGEMFAVLENAGQESIDNVRDGVFFIKSFSPQDNSYPKYTNFEEKNVD